MLLLFADSIASLCLDKARTAIGIIIDMFSLHGLILNFGKGKTEICLNLKGSESKDLYVDILDAGGFLVPNRIYGVSKINVVSRYKHVGSLHPNKASGIPEAKHRGREAKSALKEIGLITKSKVSSSRACKFLISSLAISRLCVNIVSISFLLGECFDPRIQSIVL